MNDNRQIVDFLMTMAFSLFGMLLIFGLGFIFPLANPYLIIKWIVIVCAAVFAYSLLTYVVRGVVMMRKNKKGSKK
ncbi:MAG: hypothetical protein ACHQUA_01755 [Microgenomates group bacterium]